MAYKKYYKTFTFQGENITINAICYAQSTSYGFHHCCTDMEILSKTGIDIWQSDKSTFCQYYNRTWERYEFQSVLLKALHRMKVEPKTVNQEAHELIKHYGEY